MNGMFFLKKRNLSRCLCYSNTCNYEIRNESIYPEEVKNRIIFTNTLKKQRSSFMGIKVILSTKCTIFNPMLEELGIFKIAPVNNIVVDEASQISILSYIVCSIFFQIPDRY